MFQLPDQQVVPSSQTVLSRRQKQSLDPVFTLRYSWNVRFIETQTRSEILRTTGGSYPSLCKVQVLRRIGLKPSCQNGAATTDVA